MYLQFEQQIKISCVNDRTSQQYLDCNQYYAVRYSTRHKGITYILLQLGTYFWQGNITPEYMARPGFQALAPGKRHALQSE